MSIHNFLRDNSKNLCNNDVCNINMENYDNFIGSAGNDIIIGAGSESSGLAGGQGNDVIYGGTGKDIVIFSGVKSSYNISSSIQNLKGYN